MAPKLPVIDRVAEEDLDDAPKGKWLDAIKIPLNDTLTSNKTLMSGGLTFAQNINSEVKEFDIQIPDAWTLLTPLNSWHTTGVANVPLRYTKHPDGTVEIQGELVGGAAPLVGTLPLGYRPQYPMWFPAYDPNTLLLRGFSVDPNGDISVPVGASSAFNVRYLCSDATPFPNSKFPITISTKFDKKPICCLVVGIMDMEGTDPRKIGCAMQIDWEFGSTSGKSSIVVKNLCGLPYNRKYRVKLLIVGE